MHAPASARETTEQPLPLAQAAIHCFSRSRKPRLAAALLPQRMAVLYGPEFHPPPGKTRAPAELPLLQPTNRHSHFVFNHKDTVRWGNYTWH